MPYVWLSLTIFLLLVEAYTVQLVTIWFAVGSITALVTSFFDIPSYLQVLIFVIISLLSLLATRPLVRKFQNKKTQPTNADRNIGAQGLVTEAIDNDAGTGQVTVNSMGWTARSKNGEVIDKGSMIIVLEIQGAKLIVSPKNNN